MRCVYYRGLGARIGRNCLLNAIEAAWPHQLELGEACVVERDVVFKFDGPFARGRSIVMGDHVFIGTRAEFNIRESIRVGNDTLIAAGCRFIDHNHGTARGSLIRVQEQEQAPIVIGSDCWVGANAVVLCGVSIGDGAVVGAGSVVTRSIPAGEIWAGVPARKIGNRKHPLI